ncbi:MAG TPA: glycosyltransferase family 2 protein [Candidatus Magasanikbacteria bacterium]|nr:MAG: hypothetical protein A3I74_00325 [Candidatus Magasanikbacteria bacterium RIFCSPLOWO2_02_FULL_47_16]OGH80103.1 MAG: hypothetical protein A3C10_02905 [Candidatus Magasanikbacteria bacterium RIFCSPHIGHO2_02_FULL_48_18]HAZ28931.1 glycosyltransferase family 2 protein [Candidatus Magasanikbacteria bacterium]
MFLALVPAFQEQQRIGSVVRSLFDCVDGVVVIDDGSSDKTADTARLAGAVVLRHSINRGQGAALETGHVYARRVHADYVLHFDGDGQFDPNDIAPALRALKDSGADVLFGSRFLDRRSTIPWFKKKLVLPAARRINAFFTGLKLSDAHNGFRIFNQSALSKIRMTHDRMAHATEIPALVKKHHLSYIEFPVKVTYHEYGQGVRGGAQIIKDLLFARFIK